MNRSLLPSALLFALAFAFQVQPRFGEDFPQLADARGGKIVRRPSNVCSCGDLDRAV